MGGARNTHGEEKILEPNGVNLGDIVACGRILLKWTVRTRGVD